MKKLSVFVGMYFCLASFGAQPVVSTPAVELGPVTVRPVTPDSIRGELVADKVSEIGALNRAQILAPRFVFSADFGYGTEIYPDLRVGMDTTTISHWICAQYGYGRAAGVFGTRPNLSNVLVESRGKGRPAKDTDLVLAHTLSPAVAANLTCYKY